MENNKNMTAVEWLIERLEINNSVSRQGEFWNLLKNQAKAMEKEQHGLTFARGYMSGYAGAKGHESVDFDKYYEKQYGK